MDKEFLSELLLATRLVGLSGLSTEALYVITELSKFIKSKDEDITVKEYITLLDSLNKELKANSDGTLSKEL